ncbi:MAG: hypothetical protein NWE99_09360 [Candidatus Bathyarchaeota archaeon]|nr:hypothetical protein [Candidatus Bathyarchaeota archaeon]
MKTALLTPLYLSVSWVLTVSYQLFTDTAVRAVSVSIGSFWPAAAAWLNANMSMIVFIYAFTWIFVLSSVIPQALLGKERSVLIQYFVCLLLAFLAFSVQGLLLAYGGVQAQQLFSVATFLNHPALAVIYLIIPYLVMIGIDIHARRRRRSEEETTRLLSSSL